MHYLSRLAVGAGGICYLVASVAQTSPAMREIVDSDQRDRAPHTAPNDWSAVPARDSDRRRQVLELLCNGSLVTSSDLSGAALVFQHGSSSTHYQSAFSLAVLALKLDPSSREAEFLTRAAEDRLLLSQGKPQRHGTQTRVSPSGQFYAPQTEPTPPGEPARLAWSVSEVCAANGRS